MEREAVVLPLNIYIDTTAMQRATTVQGHLVEKDIHQVLKYIRGMRPRQRGNTPKYISQEALHLQAVKREQEI